MTNRNDIEQLFKAHYAQMYRLAVALLHDDDLARDIVHDVFASLLDSSLDITVSGGYLIKAVRNRCLNYIRDCEIHQRIANRYFLENEEYESEDWPDDETIAAQYILPLLGSKAALCRFVVGVTPVGPTSVSVAFALSIR